MNEAVTTKEFSALVAETQRLLTRAHNVLGRAGHMGPTMRGEMMSPLSHLQDTLQDNIAQMEAVAAKLPE